jgi:hypothetical protein
MSIPDGIMMGFVVDPMNSKERNVAVTGSPVELIQLVKLLGLSPNEQDLDDLIEGRQRSQPLAFSDERGSFVTLQPVACARDMLAAIAGFNPDDF